MRFLVCSFSSPGFLFPLVGLALELCRRGHHVGFASGPQATDVLAAAELTRTPRSERDGPSFNVSTWHVPISIAIDVKHIEYAMTVTAPEAIVTHHLCLSALIARARHGVPVAVLGPMSYLYPPATPVADTSAESARRLQWRLDEGSRVLNEARGLFRLPPQAAVADDHGMLGDVFMLRTDPCLETNLAALPPKVHAVGPCTWEPPVDDGEQPSLARAWAALRAKFLDPDAPVVYVHNGRAFDGPSFWPQLTEALGSAPVQVVASVGRMDTDVGVLPPNFLVGSHIPQGLVLPHASAVIASGHSSVVLGAATRGVPCVLIPHGVETPENADRLVAAGCALVVDIYTLTARGLREALDRVIGDVDMRRHCEALRNRLQALDSFEAAAVLVETMASTRAPVYRPDDASVTEAVALRGACIPGSAA